MQKFSYLSHLPREIQGFVFFVVVFFFKYDKRFAHTLSIVCIKIGCQEALHAVDERIHS